MFPRGYTIEYKRKDGTGGNGAFKVYKDQRVVEKKNQSTEQVVGGEEPETEEGQLREYYCDGENKLDKLASGEISSGDWGLSVAKQKIKAEGHDGYALGNADFVIPATTQ